MPKITMRSGSEPNLDKVLDALTRVVLGEVVNEETVLKTNISKLKKTNLSREAKFKTSLGVGFFLDFRNFIFASSAMRIKKYS